MVFDWGLSDLKLDKNMKILCVGARAGNEIVAFKELKFTNILGTDLYPNKDIIKDDMNNMQFKNNAYDFLYSHHSLEHTVYSKKAVSEMKRVVRPGGLIFVVVPVMHSERICECTSFASPKEIKKLFNLEVVKEGFLQMKTESNNNPEFRCIFKVS